MPLPAQAAGKRFCLVWLFSVLGPSSCLSYRFLLSLAHLQVGTPKWWHLFCTFPIPSPQRFRSAPSPRFTLLPGRSFRPWSLQTEQVALKLKSNGGVMLTRHLDDFPRRPKLKPACCFRLSCQSGWVFVKDWTWIRSACEILVLIKGLKFKIYFICKLFSIIVPVFQAPISPSIIIIRENYYLLYWTS